MEESKKYDLEERTEKFSLGVRDFCIKLKKDVINIEYIKQLIRAAGSIAAIIWKRMKTLEKKI